MSIRKRISALFNEVRLLIRFGFRKIGVSGYQLHQIELNSEQLIYLPIPKNACSTIKHALYEIEYGKEFDYDQAREWGYQDIHDYYNKRKSAFTGTKALKKKDATIFTVIREPVKRLISCYRNRVVDLRDLEKNKSALHRRNLPLEPDLNTFVIRLEEYREANKSIEHHSRPQHLFLGDRLDYIDEVFPLHQMKEVKAMLKELKPGLKMRAEKSGGTTFGLTDLSITALDEAIRFYENDYDLLSDYYSPNKIREVYHESAT
ncbi:sulfotransferase family 2 domain-containing protein [Fodinibius sp. Rm-B-1B1-1]|uniref:sulfotransferase family 2 domain-containing protein n=1 Tax=Fodinibius alkaliphilus TaxID=3140241 RepID=UPI00315A74F5